MLSAKIATKYSVNTVKKLLLPISTITATLLLFGQPVFATPTWIPEYQAGKTVYTSPELNLKVNLGDTSKIEGMKFISINTIRGDDLPQNQYAQALNDRIISMWTSKPDFPVNDYVTLVYVRNDANPAKGSFSINVGSKWRGNFSPSSLTDFQIPILKQYMPQDPSGGIAAIANGLNREVALQRNMNTFWLWFIGIVVVGAITQTIYGFIRAYLADRRKMQSKWTLFLDQVKALESSYRATFEELEYLKLVEYKGASLKLLEEINAVFTEVSTDFEKIVEQKKKFSWRDIEQESFAELQGLTTRVSSTLTSLNSDKIARFANQDFFEKRLAELKDRTNKLDQNHERVESFIAYIQRLSIDEADPVQLISIIDLAFETLAELEAKSATCETLTVEVRSLIENVKILPALLDKEFGRNIGLVSPNPEWLESVERGELLDILSKKVVERIGKLEQLEARLNKYWQPYLQAVSDRDKLESQLKTYQGNLNDPYQDIPQYLQPKHSQLVKMLNDIASKPYTPILRQEADSVFQEADQWLEGFKKHIKAKSKLRSYNSSRRSTAEPYLNSGEYNQIDTLISSWDYEDRTTSYYSSDSSSSSSWSDYSSSSSWDSSSSSSSWDSSSSGSDW